MLTPEEISRYVFDQRLKNRGFQRVAGVDEVGRGALAGPVVAAVCLLPPEFSLPGINDSKEIKENERISIYRAIIADASVEFAIGLVSAEGIDELGIHRASLLAMERACASLKKPVDCILVDGKYIPKISPLPRYIEAIPKGDQKSASIAAASIIAKVRRDAMMRQMHLIDSRYALNRNKGYGTKEHREAIARFGISPDFHRISFRPCQSAIR